MKPRRVSARPSGNRKPPGSTSSTGPDGDRHGPAPGPAGSALYGAIWDAVRRIPRGRVATYGQIAALAGRPGQPRLVGYALHHLPEGSKVPWHRVVNARGAVSVRTRSLADTEESLQRVLLEKEGIVFDSWGRIDLEGVRWRPRKV